MLCKAATDGGYTLFIEYDDDPLNPRVDYDCFGKMICFHRRYNLGDKHTYKEPRDFLTDKLDSPVYAKPVYNYIRKGRTRKAKLEYDRSEREWQLMSFCTITGRWYIDGTFPPGLNASNIPADFLDTALYALPDESLLEILRATQGYVILPLYLYDHSGITMSTSPFSCPWDSGQVGWIYTNPQKVKQEYGSVSKETIEKATAQLQAEVSCYDHYLTGECYGFRLFEGDEEIDSCWGFLGNIAELAGDLRACLPAECQPLVDKLDTCNENSIEQYFWNQRHVA